MNRLTALLCASLLWCAAGCSKSKSASPQETVSSDVQETPSQAVPTPVPAQAVPTAVPSQAVPTAVPSQAVPTASPVRTQTLVFVPSDLAPGTTEGLVTFCLNCRVRTATYEYCQFEQSALKTAVGKANFSAEVTVKVAMTPLKSDTFKPNDPNAPQPEGGFTNNTFSCSVLEVVPAS
tara:strand:+ start:67403 stop:67936 length:534 start_codon:yes stop_codon:yes gene_type:complete